MEKLCDLNDLDATGAFGVNVGGQAYFVVRAAGADQPRVYKNSCPHLGVELDMRENEFLDIGREFIVCANHGALFQIHDGLCIAGPCKKRSLTPVDCKVENGSVWLCADP